MRKNQGVSGDLSAMNGLDDKDKKIELLNDKYVCGNYLKNEGVSKNPLKKNESLRWRMKSELAKIKRWPALVRSFFGAPM